VGVSPFLRAADSASGEPGGLRVGVALQSLGLVENSLMAAGRERRARLVARGTIRNVECIVYSENGVRGGVFQGERGNIGQRRSPPLKSPARDHGLEEVERRAKSRIVESTSDSSFDTEMDTARSRVA
jgi:hypothetical protein